jgi:hypothetical protein
MLAEATLGTPLEYRPRSERLQILTLGALFGNFEILTPASVGRGKKNVGCRAAGGGELAVRGEAGEGEAERMDGGCW